jgi:cytochrome c553
MDPGSVAYYKKLRNLMSRFAYGIEYDQNKFRSTLTAMHSLAMRTGEQVRDSQDNNNLTTEFEYREFYLNGTWMLSTRKLRREPAFCANTSPLLVNRLNDEWWDSQMSWRYALGARSLDNKLGEIDQLRASCQGKLPYGAKDDDSNDVQLRAKFARFTPTPPATIWRPAFTDAADVVEQKSHSFAAGACSGCHGTETGTKGFHIAPAASGASAPLSKFLRSQTSASPRGVVQNYDEPTRRMDLVARFANDEDVGYADDPLLYDFKCKDIDLVDTECLKAPPVAPAATLRLRGAH